MVAIEVVYAALLGAVLASFSCVLVERVPRGESIWGRSKCACGRQLHWAENVPVLSWVALRGTARCCGARIPVRYLVAEAGAAGFCAAAVLAAGPVLGAVAGLVVLGVPTIYGVVAPKRTKH